MTRNQRGESHASHHKPTAHRPAFTDFIPAHMYTHAAFPAGLFQYLRSKEKFSYPDDLSRLIEYFRDVASWKIRYRYVRGGGGGVILIVTAIDRGLLSCAEK